MMVGKNRKINKRRGVYLVCEEYVLRILIALQTLWCAWCLSKAILRISTAFCRKSNLFQLREKKLCEVSGNRKYGGGVTRRHRLHRYGSLVDPYHK